MPIVQFAVHGSDPNRRQVITALVDSGADATIIPATILTDIGARKIDEGWARTVFGERYPVPIYTVTITIGEYVLRGIELVANERTDEIILGCDVLNELILNPQRPKRSR